MRHPFSPESEIRKIFFSEDNYLEGRFFAELLQVKVIITVTVKK
jgi:hypothetical protein